MYHPDGRVALVKNPEQLESLGDGWYSNPADVPYVEPPPPEPKCAPGCPSCVILFDLLASRTAKFNAAWDEQMTANAAMVNELAELRQRPYAVVELQPDGETPAAPEADKAKRKR